MTGYARVLEMDAEAVAKRWQNLAARVEKADRHWLPGMGYIVTMTVSEEDRADIVAALVNAKQT